MAGKLTGSKYHLASRCAPRKIRHVYAIVRPSIVAHVTVRNKRMRQFAVTIRPIYMHGRWEGYLGVFRHMRQVQGHGLASSSGEHGSTLIATNLSSHGPDSGQCRIVVTKLDPKPYVLENVAGNA